VSGVGGNAHGEAAVLQARREPGRLTEAEAEAVAVAVDLPGPAEHPFSRNTCARHGTRDHRPELIAEGSPVLGCDVSVDLVNGAPHVGEELNNHLGFCGVQQIRDLHHPGGHLTEGGLHIGV